jgi:hypothetical protein
MATIHCVEVTTVSSQLLDPFSPTVHPTDPLTVVVEYGTDFRVPIDMNALYEPLREALSQLPGWSTAVATRTGWQHLTAYVAWAGSVAWAAASQGLTERLEIRNVYVDYTQGPNALWLISTADFRGTWSASLGTDIVLMSGTTAATLDATPGLPGFIAPAVDSVGEAHVPLRGMARVGTQLRGQAHIPLVAFDASVALDLERVYLAIAGMFFGDTFTWQDFLDGWEALLHDAVLAVHIRTVTYTLALVSSAQAYQDELRYYAALSHYFCKQEEDFQHQPASGWHDRVPSH